jgi:hypothetical protein
MELYFKNTTATTTTTTPTLYQHYTNTMTKCQHNANRKHSLPAQTYDTFTNYKHIPETLELYQKETLLTLPPHSGKLKPKRESIEYALTPQV